MASRFKYRERSPETVKARASQSGGDYDSYIVSGTPTFKSKEGENTLRILPPTWDPKEWGDNWSMELWVHRDIGADRGAFLCANKMRGEPCPVCDVREELDVETWKSVRPKKRIAAYVIDRDAEKTGPQVWDFGWKLERNIAARSVNKKTGEIYAIDHPEEGYDISFTRKGMTMTNTEYLNEDVARDPSPISENEERQDRWLEYIEAHPLDSVLVFHDYDYIAKVFSGQAPPPDEQERDEPPARGAKPTRAPSRGRTPPEEDALPNDEEMADNSARARGTTRRRTEPDEPAPRGRAPARRGRDPESEDDVQEAPPPRGRRTREPEPAEAEDTAGEEYIEPEAETPRRGTQTRRAPSREEVEPPMRGRRTDARGRSEPEDEAEPEPVERARRSLNNLKDRARR